MQVKFALVFLLVTLFLCVSWSVCEEPAPETPVVMPIPVATPTAQEVKKEEDDDKKKYTLAEFFGALSKKMSGKDVYSIILHDLEIGAEDEKVMTKFFADNKLPKLQNVVVSKLDPTTKNVDAKKVAEDKERLNKFLISLFTTLQNFNTIETITVAKTSLQDPEVVKTLAALLSSLPQLKAVFFFKNGFNPASIKILSDNFNPKFDNQFKLSFNKNFIEDEGLKLVLEIAKKHTKNVQRLTLRNIGITESGSGLIADFLRSEGIGMSSFHIAENRISEVGYQKIGEAAAATKILKRFKISQAGQGSSSFEKKTMEVLGEIISKNLCKLSGSLDLFDLKYNTFTKESSGAFVEAIKACEEILKNPENKKKVVLDLSENVLPKNAMKTVVEISENLEKILPKLDEKQIEEEKKKKQEEKAQKKAEKKKKSEEKAKKKEERKKLPKEQRHKTTEEERKQRQEQKRAVEDKKIAMKAAKLAKRPAFTLVMKGTPIQSKKLKVRVANMRVLETDYHGYQPKKEEQAEEEQKEDSDSMMKDFEELLGQSEDEKPQKSKRDEL